MLGGRKAAWRERSGHAERQPAVRPHTAARRSSFSRNPSHSFMRGGGVEVEGAVAINEQTDPNLFTFGSDGRIYPKGEMNIPRNQVPVAGGRREWTRSNEVPVAGGWTRPNEIPIARGRREWTRSPRNTTGSGVRGRSSLLFGGDIDMESLFEDDLSLAIHLSLSSLAPADERPLSRALGTAPPPPDLTADESANPNLFFIGSDGRIHQKAPSIDPSRSFEEESRRSGITWLHDPMTPPPPPRITPLRSRSSADSSPATVVWQHGEAFNEQPVRSSSVRPKKKISTCRRLPPPPTRLLAPFCIQDSSKKALQDLLASQRAVYAASQSLPRFDVNQMTYENLLLLDSAPLSALERAKKGLSAEQLRTIHSVLIHTDSSSSPQCSICQEDFHQNDPALCLPHCQHVFHGECLGPWLTDHSLCPNCRRSVV